MRRGKIETQKNKEDYYYDCSDIIIHYHAVPFFLDAPKLFYDKKRDIYDTDTMASGKTPGGELYQRFWKG